MDYESEKTVQKKKGRLVYKTLREGTVPPDDNIHGLAFGAKYKLINEEPNLNLMFSRHPVVLMSQKDILISEPNFYNEETKMKPMIEISFKDHQYTDAIVKYITKLFNNFEVNTYIR